MASDDEDTPAIVIDNGSNSLKVGFSGYDSPIEISTLTGTSLNLFHEGERETFIGNRAQNMREILSLHHPIEHGIIVNWEDMVTLWEHAFHELNADPKEHGSVITEVPLNPKINREKMAEVFFEKFCTPYLHVSIPALFTLQSAGGRTTGVVVDSGEGVTSVVPFYEGHPIPSAIERLDIGGGDVTSSLIELFSDFGYSFSTTGDRELVREIKEHLDYKLKRSTFSGIDITNVHEGLLACSDVLFNPSLCGFSCNSIPQAIHQSILNCDTDIREDLYCNIVLSGGNSLLFDFSRRIDEEMIEPSRVKIISPPERKYSAWIGSSILSQFTTFSELLVSKRDYEEIGPKVIHKFL